MALQNQDREGVFYLDRESGEVKFYYDGLFDGEEVDEDFDIDEVMDMPQYQRILGIFSSDAYQVMEDFIETVSSERHQQILTKAISGRKPFRSFKDALFELGDTREQWFKFEEAAYEQIAKHWLKEHDIEADLVKKPWSAS